MDGRHEGGHDESGLTRMDPNRARPHPSSRVDEAFRDVVDRSKSRSGSMVPGAEP
jgi:hypothetical protein